MQTILVPTDFSKSSENSIRYAAELAELTKARLVLLHVFSVPVPVTDVPFTPLPLEEIAEQWLEDLKKQKDSLLQKHPHLQVKLVVKPGFVSDEIRQVIGEYKASLIILSSLGNGKTSAFFGSNTVNMIKKAGCPVIVVPVGATYKKPKNIALACDFSTIVPDSVTTVIKSYVKLFGAKLLIFDVLSPAELVTYEKAASEVNLENSLTEIKHSIYFPTGDDKAEAFKEFVESHKVDMLVMMPHNYTFVQKLFHKSATKHMALHTHIPLLSIHE